MSAQRLQRWSNILQMFCVHWLVSHKPKDGFIASRSPWGWFPIAGMSLIRVVSHSRPVSHNDGLQHSPHIDVAQVNPALSL